MLGNHWLLEQRFVAELPTERIMPTPPVAALSVDADAISLIRQAGYNIRTQLLDPAAGAGDAATEQASRDFLDQLDHGVLQQTAASDDSGPYYAQDQDTWFGDLRVLAEQAQRWPDRDQRLAQLAGHADPVIEVYAMLMQRGQFP